MDSYPANGVISGPWMATRDISQLYDEFRLLRRGPALLDDTHSFKGIVDTATDAIAHAPLRAKGRVLEKRNLKQLKACVMPAFASMLTPLAAQFFMDSHYYLPTVLEVQMIMARSKIARLAVTIDERFDCDDYAFGVKGEFSRCAYDDNRLGDCSFCFGLVMGKFQFKNEEHATCFFVAGDEKVYLVDPYLPVPWDRTVSEEPPPLDPLTVPIHPVSDCDLCSLLLV